MSFGKIFESTYTGSMVGSGPVVFAVWGYVIANTRPPGLVEINPIILGTILGAPVADIEQAIGYLESPDPKSRTPDEDGRRLIRVGQFMYKVPTWQKYRESRNDEERRAYNAEAARRSRNKRKESIQASMTINDKSASSAQAEAEAEADAEAREREALPPSPELSDDHPKSNTNGLLDLEAKIRALRPSWRLPMTYAEQQAIMHNRRAVEALEAQDWETLKEYLNARLPEGSTYWQPRGRQKFLEGITDVFSHATEWKRKQAKPAAAKAQEPVIPFVPMDVAELEEIFGKRKSK